ncbi:redox-regulated ATPase YchF [Chloroflexota bacterium]
MSIDIGIIGLAQSGKTTIFNALTRSKADSAGYTAASPTHHLCTAKVPEPRLQALTDMLQPKRVVPAEVRYIDIGASVKSLAKDKTTIGGELLNQLGNADALINVVRAFPDESIPHVEGSLDIERDISTMNLELIFSDLSIIERRLERIETSLKGAKPPERQNLLHEQEQLLKFKVELEQDRSIRDLKLTDTETRMIANYQFLTAKPLLTLVNIGEEQLTEAPSLEAKFASLCCREGCGIMALCGKLEMELGQLDNSAAEEFRTDFGLQESGLDRVIKLSYDLLGLISFFTTASSEVKAWSIKAGTSALKAAGKIHSDIERGFIRAEVIGYNDLCQHGNLPEARKKGLLRLEGKDYIVEDGDIITFLFNV